MVFIYLILSIIPIRIILFVKSSNLLSDSTDSIINKKITFNRDSWHFWYYSNVFSCYTFKGFRFVCLKIYKSNFIQAQKEMIVAIYKKSCPMIDWK